MRLTLVIASLAGGGAERVMATLGDRWLAEGHEVTLVTLYPDSHDVMGISAGVSRVVVGAADAGAGRLRRAQLALGRLIRLRRVIEESRPEVVVSFMTKTNILTLLAMRGTGVPVIVSERIDPRCHRVGPMVRVLRHFEYRRAARVVVQSSAVQQWAGSFLNPDRVVRIANPVSVRPTAVVTGRAADGVATGVDARPMVVAMGRLVSQKGFDVLITAFARLAPEFPEWRLVIAGEGEERERLRRLAEREGVADHVEMPGWVESPSELLLAADLFVLSSRFEGFPNALLEAMAHGVPVVATDCPSGPAEIVREGVDGYLVPPDDVPGLVEGMRRLMTDPAGRARIGGAAAEVVERFSIERVSAEWNRILEECAR